MNTKAPPAPSGQFEYIYKWLGNYRYKRINIELVCHLEYESAEDGQGFGPSHPAQANLIAAYANGMDILEMLDDGYVCRIEEQAVATFLE